MEYYVAKAKTITLPMSKRNFKLRKGIHHLPAELVEHSSANDHGIKPVCEMTDAEFKELGIRPAQRDDMRRAHGALDVAHVEPEAENSTVTPDGDGDAEAPENPPVTLLGGGATGNGRADPLAPASEPRP